MKQSALTRVWQEVQAYLNEPDLVWQLLVIAACLLLALLGENLLRRREPVASGRRPGRQGQDGVAARGGQHLRPAGPGASGGSDGLTVGRPPYNCRVPPAATEPPTRTGRVQHARAGRRRDLCRVRVRRELLGQ